MINRKAECQLVKKLSVLSQPNGVQFISVRCVFLLSVFALLAGVLTLESSADAAENTLPGNQNTKSTRSLQLSGKGGMLRPASADKDYAHEKLTTFVDLPDVPRYSGAGAIFIDGLKYPNDSFGQDVTMTFGVMEQAPQVSDWYKSALQQYQWTIYPVKPDPSARDSYPIDAGKGKYNINLMIKSVTGRPYRSRVVIRYKIGK